MSGSRAILLKLSVQDADLVLQTLRNVGSQGEAALARLDAAAQRAAGTGGGSAGGGIAGLRGQLANVGFQVQDFAVQVQGGTSALTALSQQGSQLLGAFGPSGAIAGAVLTVGLLASRLLDLGKASETAAVAERNHAAAIDGSREIYEDAISRSERLARARIAERQATLEARLTEERTALARVNALSDDLLRGLNSPRPYGDGLAARARDRQDASTMALLRERAVDAERISGRIAELNVELERLRIIGQSSHPGEQYGPPAPSASDLRARDPSRSGGTSASPAGQLEDTMARIRAEVEQQRTQERRRFDDMVASVDPATQALRRYEEQQRQINEAMQHGLITEDEYRSAVDRTTEAYNRNIKQINERAAQSDGVARQLGLTFSSAFEDAIVKGEKFSKVLQGIAQDIARLILRKSITEPISNSITSALSGGSGGDGNFLTTALSAIRSILPFEGGGIMTSAGPLPLHRYAGGGIADRPQLALFGEGRKPEAYVPLPDGRTIPVRMQGNSGTVVNFSLNIDARNSTPDAVARLEQQLPQRIRAVVEDAFRRGGSLSRAARNA